MKSKYLTAKRESMRSGAGGKRFEFWEEMDQLLGSRPIATAGTVTIDSTDVDVEHVDEGGDDEEEDDGMEEDAEGSTKEMEEEDTSTPTDGPAEAGVTRESSGRSVWRKPLKRRSASNTKLLQCQLSDMMRRQEKQQESDTQMLSSLLSTVNRLVDCIEKRTQAGPPQMSPAPYTYPHPSPHTFQQHPYLFMQQQQQSQSPTGSELVQYTHL